MLSPRAVRRVERPARCRCRRRAPPTWRTPAPIMNTYQLARFSFGNARSFAPIIIGMKKFPITAGIDGIRKKNSITTPWAVNARLYASSVRIAPVGREQVEPDEPGGDPADDEEDGDRDQVQDADPLVVDGEQPRPDAVDWCSGSSARPAAARAAERARRAGRVGNGGAHVASSPATATSAASVSVRRPTGAGVRSVRSGVCPLQTAGCTRPAPFSSSAVTCSRRSGRA